MKERTEISMQLYQMLAILSDRNAIIKKKESEQTQKMINGIY